MTSTDYVLVQRIENKEVAPYSDIKAPVGTGVTLTVSYRRDEQYTTVPRLVGLNVQQAKSSLWDNGLNVGKLVYDESVEDIIARRSAKVYKQSQALGMSAQRGSCVTLYLTTDEELLKSSIEAANVEAKRLEEQRRKDQEERRKAAEESAEGENPTAPTEETITE